MQDYDRTQLTDWINNAPPAELITVGKQVLAKISALPPEQRDQFTREIGNDQTLAKLFGGVNA